MIQGTKETNTSLDKDPLIVEKGPMSWSRAKWVNKVDEILINARKSKSFMLGLGVKTSWNNVVQALDGGDTELHYVTT